MVTGRRRGLLLLLRLHSSAGEHWSAARPVLSLLLQVAENARLREDKMGLTAQIEILNAKLQMSAFGTVQHGGGMVRGL